MDLALCQELLRQAEQSGASEAALFLTSSTRRTDSIRFHKSNSCTIELESAKLIVQCSNGSCSIDLYAQNRMFYEREALLDKVRNACQAARLASTWGQNVDLLARELKRFETEAACAVQKNNCTEIDNKTQCSEDCFSGSCLLEEDFVSVLNELDNRFLQSGVQAEYQAEIASNAVVETCFIGEQVTTQKHIDTVLKQSFIPKNSGRIVCLPDYRTIGKITDILEHKTVIDAGEAALGIEKSGKSEAFELRDAGGLCISSWGMAVLGHETAHLNIDVSPGGRIVMNRAECLPVPVSSRTCLGTGIRISLEGGLTRDSMFERLPDNTLVADAPSCWMRKNDSILHVFFQSAWILKHGKFDKPIKPVILKLDLQKIWFYCRLAAKPYTRIALKCGNGITDFQAPWGYFDVKPEIGYL